MGDDKKPEQLGEDDLDNAVGAGQKFTFKVPDTDLEKLRAAQTTSKQMKVAPTEEKAKRI